MQILGASRKQLVKLLLTESIYISIAGTCLGIALAGIIVAMSGGLIFNTLVLPYSPVGAASVIFNLLFTFIIGVAIAPLASIYSVLVITKFDSYSTLREGE